jgi:hypothetical protein
MIKKLPVYQSAVYVLLLLCTTSLFSLNQPREQYEEPLPIHPELLCPKPKLPSPMSAAFAHSEKQLGRRV